MNCQLAATLKCLHQSILVIGYGDPLHRKDITGQQIAQTVADWQIPNVTAIAAHQLTLGLIEHIAETDIVIFVVACLDETLDVQVHPLSLGQSDMVMTDECDPSVLLATTQALYRNYPQAWEVRVPRGDSKQEAGLSSLQENIEMALDTVERLIQTVRAN